MDNIFTVSIITNKVKRLLEGYPVRAKGQTYRLGHYEGNDSRVLLLIQADENNNETHVPVEDISFGAFLDMLEIN